MEALRALRELFSYLPLNNTDGPPKQSTDDFRARSEEALRYMVPDDPNTPYCMKQVVLKIVDDHTIFEIMPNYAQNILCGFARMEGRTVGIVANNPMHLAGCLDIESSKKAARFVRFLDAFNIPILTFVDVPGFLPGTAQVV